MSRVYMGLGSNLGNRTKNLSKAIEEVGRYAGKVVSVSAVYETEPWGFMAERKFLNMVIGVETELSPLGLLNKLHEIESGLGRRRGGTHYESRTIDIDILFYDDLILNAENLIIPHPHIADRRFVLEPLYEIEPGLVHPVFGKSIAELLEVCPDKSPAVLWNDRERGR